MNATNRHGISGGLAGPWEAGVLGDLQHPWKFSGGAQHPQHPLQIFWGYFIAIMMINYVHFTRHIFFISFIVSLSRLLFSLQN